MICIMNKEAEMIHRADREEAQREQEERDKRPGVKRMNKDG